MTQPAIESLLAMAPVIPVIVIDDAQYAIPLAEALVAGGLRVIEVTLRTSAALDAIRAMSDVPGAIVGAGTVLDSARLDAAAAAGARFVVSPGFTDSLARAAESARVPLLPGAVTPSEVMAARDAGYRRLKFFPAEACSGIRKLRSYASVFADVLFCPTGGIDAESARDYLALSNVACVGGSWLAPVIALHAADWSGITRRAREAAALRAAAG
ncbi:MAG: bifunctional 4-hydroxy-2-oxoglutarate aldolase/2-dehydro-3-deoxy-phosphogluconate aldolase [Burkholderiaceae bacterium]|nr:bifunctional 4-hydroxy-2-oxoglutarate aldolase/2-dehydro-3-deoxy-phosphogluconate aldolase [Burkholderiaceae bacterium]